MAALGSVASTVAEPPAQSNIATRQQLEVALSAGVRRLILANELVAPSDMDWVAAEVDRDPALEIYLYVDSIEPVQRALEAVGWPIYAGPREVWRELVQVGTSPPEWRRPRPNTPHGLNGGRKIPR